MPYSYNVGLFVVLCRFLALICERNPSPCPPHSIFSPQIVADFQHSGNKEYRSVFLLLICDIFLTLFLESSYPLLGLPNACPSPTLRPCYSFPSNSPLTFLSKSKSICCVGLKNLYSLSASGYFHLGNNHIL